ncbi:MAG: GNAT family N-acetyltransferase [Chloroflexota bacterium]
MNIQIRFADERELAWLLAENDYLPDGMVEQKIAHNEYIVAVQDEMIVGYLRFSYFWSFIPYIDIIYVQEELRCQGIGRKMLTVLEGVAREQGQSFILSSSQSDEAEPQAWHRHVGFRDAGALVELRPLQDVTELIFVKHINLGKAEY